MWAKFHLILNVIPIPINNTNAPMCSPVSMFRTKQSGWRFRLTNSQEIPLSTTDLEALIVMPRNIRTTAQFRIVAAINVLSTFDKWFSWAFKK
jgi:hypothetical protein